MIFPEKRSPNFFPGKGGKKFFPMEKPRRLFPFSGQQKRLEAERSRPMPSGSGARRLQLCFP
jgi:hypothetical protein